jgi:hypothetical protein
MGRIAFLLYLWGEMEHIYSAERATCARIVAEAAGRRLGRLHPLTKSSTR